MFPNLTWDNQFNSYVAFYRGSTGWMQVRYDPGEGPGEGFSGPGMSWVLYGSICLLVSLSLNFEYFSLDDQSEREQG